MLAAAAELTAAGVTIPLLTAVVRYVRLMVTHLIARPLYRTLFHLPADVVRAFDRAVGLDEGITGAGDDGGAAFGVRDALAGAAHALHGLFGAAATTSEGSDRDAVLLARMCATVTVNSTEAFWASDVAAPACKRIIVAHEAKFNRRLEAALLFAALWYFACATVGKRALSFLASVKGVNATPAGLSITVYAGFGVACWLQFEEETIQGTLTAALLLGGIWGLTLYQLIRFIAGDVDSTSVAQVADAGPAAGGPAAVREGAFEVRDKDALLLKVFLERNFFMPVEILQNTFSD